MSRAGWRRPQSVLVVVYTGALDVLLLERAQPRGFWQSVTGSLDWGETPAEAAAREVFEETGLAGNDIHDAGISRSFPILPQWRARYAPDVETNLEHLFYLRLSAPQRIRIDPGEHASAEWLPIGQALDKVSSWTNREALERLTRPGGPTTSS